MAPQCTLMNCAPRRLLWVWMSLASTPLPVPVSPESSTVVLVGATMRILSNTSFMAGLLVRMMSALSSLQKLSRR